MTELKALKTMVISSSIEKNKSSFEFSISIWVMKIKSIMKLRRTAIPPYKMLSRMNGILINQNGAPTSFITVISFLRLKMVMWIAFKIISVPPIMKVKMIQKIN